MKNERKTNIELLRILAMIMIVFSHFYSHGGFEIVNNTINRFFLKYISTCGKIGVNIFVFISGYFLVEKNSVSPKKIIKLWIQVFFYSFLIYMIINIGILKSFSIKGLLKALMPITSKFYWFASSYFVMYLLSPYINIIFNRLNKGEFRKLIMMTTIIWCIIPTLTNMDLECNNLLWFIYLYGIAAYINRFSEDVNLINVKVLLLVLIIILISIAGGFTIFEYLRIDYKLFFGIQKLPTLIVSLLIFIIALKTPIRMSKIINGISKCTFGVYLIHDHSSMRDMLWIKMLHVSDYCEKWYFIIYTVGIVLIVFTTCSLLEYVRINIFRNIDTLFRRFKTVKEEL